VNNFGYAEYYPSESLSTGNLKKVNASSYEDDIMLKPSADWLSAHKDKSFVAKYRTGAGYDDYQCLNHRYGSETYAKGAKLNSYLNYLRLQDFFVKNLIDQYKELGLYDHTIFVIFGDHGEGFGEHARYQHYDTIYEEGLKVPLIIHAPGWFDDGGHVTALSNHTDILPTIVEMLGYEVASGTYTGYSLLHALPEDRYLKFSCFHKNTCLARKAQKNTSTTMASNLVSFSIFQRLHLKSATWHEKTQKTQNNELISNRPKLLLTDFTCTCPRPNKL
jgi:lipoteichoic acid synthase